MNAPLLPVLTLLLALPGAAQTPPRPTYAPLSPAPASTLQMSADERQFFALGLTLSRAAFAYAELDKQAALAAKTHTKSAQVKHWGILAPIARRNRAAARDGFAQAARLMRTLGAPPDALAPIARAASELAEPLTITPEARPLLASNSDAAQTLSSLSEFGTLSALPEDPALRRWLTAPEINDAAPVWYGEGEVLGLAQIAAADGLPGLLPPAEQIATDLRGLRDWLALRLPDMPSPAQIALKNALEAFLKSVAQGQRPGVKSRKLLTQAQLQALGALSRQLQTQALEPPPVAPDRP